MVKRMRFTDFKISKSKKNAGFTLVELLIAVAFFSFILLFISAGFIALNRQFVKGRTARTVQNDARFVIEDITRSLRASRYGQLKIADDVAIDTTMCFGSSQYTWTTLSNFDTDDKRYADSGERIRLARSEYNGGDCQSSTVETQNSTELIGSDTVVQFIDIEGFGSIPGLFKVIVVLSTQQDEIIGSNNGADANCESLQTSGSVNPEYCSVVKFETVVKIRN